MKGFILDSTYKETTVIDDSGIPLKISSDNINYNSGTDFNLNINSVNSSYISHQNKNNKFNPYNIVDYL